jgi:hypothetical protein
LLEKSRRLATLKRNHHYVPQFWQRLFANAAGIVYAREGSSVRQASTKNLMSADWIYTVFDSNWLASDSIEDSLSQAESAAAQACRTLIASTLPPTGAVQDQLRRFTALQACRHPDIMGRGYRRARDLGEVLVKAHSLTEAECVSESPRSMRNRYLFNCAPERQVSSNSSCKRLDHSAPRTLNRRTVEHVFGTFKSWMGHTHFLMRRLPNVSTEMSLAVLTYNLKRVLSILGFAKTMRAMQMGRKPFNLAVCAHGAHHELQDRPYRPVPANQRPRAANRRNPPLTRFPRRRRVVFPHSLDRGCVKTRSERKFGGPRPLRHFTIVDPGSF